MSPLLALTLTATLSTPAAPPPPQAPLLTQAVTLAMGAQAATPPGGDSLKNGAIAGAIAGGLAMGGFIALLCHAMNDTGDPGDCIKATVLWAGIGAAGGAALGAGVDALFTRGPGTGVRATTLPKAPSARVRLRF